MPTSSKFNPTLYAKNVLKSTGFIAVGAIKGVNPAMTSFASSGVELAKSMYQEAKDFKYGARESATKFADSEYAKFGKELLSNAISDLKSGQFYNKERQDKSVEDALGFSMDDDFEWDDDASKDEPVSTHTIQTVGSNIINANSAALGNSTKKVVSSQRASTNALLGFGKEAVGKLNLSLATINTTLLGFHQDIAQPLNAHIQNSTNFYKVATEQLSKQTEMLAHIEKILSDRFEPKSTSSRGFNKKYSAWGQVFNGDLPNLNEWASNVKKNFKDSTDSLGMLGMLKDMFSPEMLANMKMLDEFNSPIAALMSMGLSFGMRRSSWGKSLLKGNTRIKNLMAASAARMSKRADDGSLLGSLFKLLDIVPKGTNKFNPANYEKGRVDWTGKDAKALREVIPVQLAQIVSLLSGEEPRVFNYETGRWETTSSIYNRYQRQRRNTVRYASEDFRSRASKEFSRERNLGRFSTSTKSFEKDYDNLMMVMAVRNINPEISYDRLVRYLNKYKLIGDGEGQINKQNLKALYDILQDPKNTRYRAGFASSVYSARSAHTDLMNNMGTGDAGITALRNGSGIFRASDKRKSVYSGLMDSVDGRGKSLSDYLSHFYTRLDDITNLLSAGGSGSKKNRRKANRGGINFTATGTDRNYQPATNRFEREQARLGNLKKKKADWTRSKNAREDARTFDENDWYDVLDYNTGENRNTIDKLFDLLEDAFYGQNKDNYRNGKYTSGLIDIITDIPKDIGKSLKSLLDDWKTKFDKFMEVTHLDRVWEKFKGTEFAKRMANTYKGTVGWAKNAAKSTRSRVLSGIDSILGNYRKGKDDTFYGDNTEGTAAYGGQVQRSGMVSVSEGELIIPAELNPFYDKPVNKSKQIATENRNKNKWLSDPLNDDADFWGSFAKGGRPRSRKDINRHKKKQQQKGKYKSKAGKAISKGARAFKKAVTSDAAKQEYANMAEDVKTVAEDIGTGIGHGVNNIKDFVNEAREKASEGYQDFKEKYTNIGNALDGVGAYAKRLGSALEHSANTLFGKDNLQKGLKTASDVKRMIKPFLPETLAGGTIGALIGAAATGSPLGLLGGFVIGGGVSLVKHSNEFSKYIFGEEDEYGNLKGGKLPPKLAKFLKNRVPGLAKSGVVGAGLGLLGLAPGGLLGGFVLGVGLDLLSDTRHFKDFIFGHEGADGVRRGGIVGSIKLRVIDPMANFVEKSIAGAGDYIKKNITDPLKRLFQPLGDFAKAKLSQIFDAGFNFVTGALKDKVITPLAEKLDVLFKPLTKFVGGLAKGALGLGKAIISAPFRLAGRAGDKLKRHNIRMGYSSLSPEERMAMEGQRYGFGKRFGLGKTFTNSDYTKMAAGTDEWEALTDEERESLFSINPIAMNERKKTINQKRQQLSELLGASLVDGGLNDKKTLRRMRRIMNDDKFRSGDSSDLKKWLEEQYKDRKIGDRGYRKALEAIDTNVATISNLSRDQKSLEKERDTIRSSILMQYGVDINDFTEKDWRQMRMDQKSLDQKKFESQLGGITTSTVDDTAGKKLDEALNQNPVASATLDKLDSIDQKLGDINNNLTGVNAATQGMAAANGVEVDSGIVNGASVAKTVENIKSAKPEDLVSKLQSSSDTADVLDIIKQIRDQQKQNEESAKKRSSVINTDGGLVELIEDRDGNVIPNMRSATTKDAIDRNEEDRKLRNKFFNTFGNFASLFGLSKEDKDAEDKEKKTSIFGTLWKGVKSIFSGAAGILGKIFSVIKGIGSGIAKFSTVILPAIGAITTIGTLLAKLFGKDVDASAPMDMAQEIITGESVEEYQDPNRYQEDSWYDNTLQHSAKALITGNRFGVGGWVPRTIERGKKIGAKLGAGASKLGSGIKSAASKLSSKLPANNDRLLKIIQTSDNVDDVAKAAQKLSSSKTGNKLLGKLGGALDTIGTKGVAGAAKDAGKAGVSKLGAKVLDLIKYVLKKFAKFLKKNPDDIVKAVDGISGKLLKLVAKGATKLGGAAAILSKVTTKLGGWPATLLLAGIAAEDGWENAQVNFGILEEPTIPMRAISALVAGVNDIFLGLFETSDLIDLGIKILNILGIKFDDLEQQRAEAQAEFEAYNASVAPEDRYNSVQDYLKNEYDLYTTQDKIKRFGSNVLKGAKNLGSKAIGGIKSVGSKIGGAISTGVGTAKNAIGFGVNVAKTFNPINTVKLGIKALQDPKAAAEELKGQLTEVKDSFNKLLGSPKDFSITNIIKKLMDSTDPKKNKNADTEATEVVKSTDSSKSKSLLSILNDLTYSVLRTLLFPVLGLVKGVRSIFGFLTGEKTGDSEIDGEIQKATNDSSSTSSSKDNGGGVLKKIGNWWNNLWNKDNTEATTVLGSGSGIHVSQKGSFRRFGRSTVDANGCGPAAAATVLRSYGRNASLDDTVNYATVNGYVAGASGVGTKAGFFGDIFNRTGIRSRYLSAKNSIKNAIGSGNPTVLLGQDRSNKSKLNSPFGPNPHYVVARGYDANGNVIIDDPELNNTAIYNKSILNNTKLGVATGGDSGLLPGLSFGSSTIPGATTNALSMDKVKDSKGDKIFEKSKVDTAVESAKAEVANGDYIGKYVKKYESGSTGSATISKGTGDYGGVSFGSYQFPSYKQEKTTEGNLPIFWNKYYADKYPGIVPGNNEAFKQAWLDAVNKDPNGFFANEHSFIASQYYTPAANYLKGEYGVGDPGVYDRGAQEAIWSTAVQMGPKSAAKLFKNAGASNNLSPTDYITRVYDYKYNNVDKNFKSSSTSVRDSIRNRYLDEKQIILGLAGQKPIDPDEVNGAFSPVSGSSSTASSTSSGSSFDLGSILDSFFSNAFRSIGNKIGGIAGSIISTVFGGNNSSSSSSSLSESNNSGFLSTAGTAKENKLVETMNSIIGKNNYTMTADRERVFDTIDKGAEMGYGDCSATVRKVIERATNGAVNIGGNTDDQYNNYSSRGGLVVLDNSSTGPSGTSKIDESKLRPGDTLYYSRPNSNYSAGRKDRVGHVEMYMGNGIRAGHGSGVGPKLTDIHSGEEYFLKAIRFVHDGQNGFASTTPGTETSFNATKTTEATASGSGLVRSYDFTKNTRGGASEVIDLSGVTNATTSRIVSTKSTGNDINSKLDKLIELISLIVTNTTNNAVLPSLVELMKQFIQISSAINKNGSSNNPRSEDIRNDINQQISAMQAKLERIAQTV